MSIFSRQPAQLVVLALVHIGTDMFAGALPAILPALRERFALSLGMGVLLLTALNLTSNGVQLVTGHLRQHARMPLLMPLGLLFSAGIVFCGWVPMATSAIGMLLLLTIVTGSGVAIVHPEGLRAVNRLDDIPGSVSSSVFMVGGFIGYYGGAWVGSLLVTGCGLRGLVWLALVSVVLTALIYVWRIRLAVENDHTAVRSGTAENVPWFWSLMLVAIPANTASVFIPNLLPSCLHGLGFELSFGGFSSFMFGIGGVAGALVWGWLARRWGELRCISISLLAAVPFTITYLLVLSSRQAVILLIAAGFCGCGPYSLVVALAARARGLILGQRMAFIVGGSWGAASLVLLAMGVVAERLGVLVILHLSWVGYLTAGVLAFVLARRCASAVPPNDRTGEAGVLS